MLKWMVILTQPSLSGMADAYADAFGCRGGCNRGKGASICQFCSAESDGFFIFGDTTKVLAKRTLKYRTILECRAVTSWRWAAGVAARVCMDRAEAVRAAGHPQC